MKICMLTSSFPRFEGDGAGLFVFHLARTLAAAGQVVEVVAPWDAGSAGYEKMGDILVHRFKYSPWNRLNLAYGPGGIPEKLRANAGALSALPLFTFSFLARAAGVAQGCDVVHAHWLYSGLVAGILRSVLGVPAVLTLRGSDLKYMLRSRMLGAAAKLASNWVNRVTTVSFAMEDLARRMGCREDRIETIPNGVEFSLFAPMPSECARARLGLPAGRPIILFVGSLTENKGLRPLLRAFRTVRQRGAQALLALVGQGALQAALEQTVLEHGLEEYVLFAGQQPQSQLPLWYNSADLLVLPSFSEGRPNVVLEAMACGTPVAASDIPGIRELAVEGGAFYLFKPGDTAGIAEAILHILNRGLKATAGPGLRTHLMECGLTWERCAERYIRCYLRARQDA